MKGTGEFMQNGYFEINDLRSALEFLSNEKDELIETDVPVELNRELSGVYRHIGAGGTVMRPTKTGPAMIFNNIKGHPGARVVIGVLGSRNRVAKLLGTTPERIAFMMNECLERPMEPVTVSGNAPCREVVHYASDEDFDIRKILPAPTNTPYDAGPYITLGMCYATHPDTGVSDVTIHRMCLLSRDEMSIFSRPEQGISAKWQGGPKKRASPSQYQSA